MPAKWQIRQMCFKAGAHLPHRPGKLHMWDKYLEPYQGRYTPPAATEIGYSFASYSNRHDPVTPYGKWHPRLQKGIKVTGNLSTEQYRFFLGHACKVSGFAQCRVCLRVSENTFERREHQRTSQCASLLGEALQALMQLARCLVCGKQTSNTAWGAPLCLPPYLCEELWKFEVCCPLPLRMTLQDVNQERITRAAK